MVIIIIIRYINEYEKTFRDEIFLRNLIIGITKYINFKISEVQKALRCRKTFNLCLFWNISNTRYLYENFSTIDYFILTINQRLEEK